MDEGVGNPVLIGVLQDVVQVVDAVKTEGEVEIARSAVSARRHQVVVECHFVGDNRLIIRLHHGLLL